MPNLEVSPVDGGKNRNLGGGMGGGIGGGMDAI